MIFSPRSEQSGRVVVGFSASMQNEAALATALLVAEKIGAEICGVFLQERELLEHAGLNFRLRSGSSDHGSALAPVSHEAVLAALDREIQRWRDRLSTEAERRKLNWSFEVKPEGPGNWLSRDIASGDLLILIRDSVSESLSPRSQKLIELAGQIPSLIIGTGSFAASAEGPVAAILHEGVSKEPTLEAALSMMSGQNGTLHLIAASRRSAPTGSWADELRSFVSRRGHSVVIHAGPPQSIADVARLINTLKPAITVGDVQQPLFEHPALAASLIRLAASPFLLLGRGDDPAQ